MTFHSKISVCLQSSELFFFKSHHQTGWGYAWGRADLLHTKQWELNNYVPWPISDLEQTTVQFRLIKGIQLFTPGRSEFLRNPTVSWNMINPASFWHSELLSHFTEENEGQHLHKCNSRSSPAWHSSENWFLPLNISLNQQFSSLSLYADLLSGNKAEFMHKAKTSTGNFLHSRSTSRTRLNQLRRLKKNKRKR